MHVFLMLTIFASKPRLDRGRRGLRGELEPFGNCGDHHGALNGGIITISKSQLLPTVLSNTAPVEYAEVD